MESPSEKPIPKSVWLRPASPTVFGVVYVLLGLSPLLYCFLIKPTLDLALRGGILVLAAFPYGLLLLLNARLAEQWLGLPGKLNKRGKSVMWLITTFLLFSPILEEALKKLF